MYSRPKASSSAAAAASAATRLTWWVAASAGKTASSSGLGRSRSFQTHPPARGPGEDGVEQRLGQLRVVPDHHARLRAGERLARAAGHDVGALAQRILEL